MTKVSWNGVERHEEPLHTGRRQRLVGPYHEFVLLSEAANPYSAYGTFMLTTPRVQLADDLIEYVYDSLEWISTINPANPNAWKGCGINRWGPTIINQAGATTARRVFSAWRDLFAAAPPQMELRGALTTWPDGAQEHQVLLVERDSLVAQLDELARYARLCLDGKCYILHFGV